MPLLVLGLNHQTAPLPLRERVATDAGQLPAALAALGAVPGVEEAALLSTCNRTELYAMADDDGRAVADWLASHPGDAGDLHGYLYHHSDAAAARHLFRVATGLDSLVLGEPQILGQVKDAWAMARGAGALGGTLDRLFQNAFATAKRATCRCRSTTGHCAPCARTARPPATPHWNGHAASSPAGTLRPRSWSSWRMR